MKIEADVVFHLVVEIKGIAASTSGCWRGTMVKRVNNMGRSGRWAFAELTDLYDVEAAFERLVDGLALMAAMA